MSKFMLSVILRTSFASEINPFDDEEAPLVKNAREIFEIFQTRGDLKLIFMGKKGYV